MLSACMLIYHKGHTDDIQVYSVTVITGEEVSIDKQVACEECPRWLKMTEVACEKTEVAVC